MVRIELKFSINEFGELDKILNNIVEEKQNESLMRNGNN